MIYFINPIAKTHVVKVRAVGKEALVYNRGYDLSDPMEKTLLALPDWSAVPAGDGTDWTEVDGINEDLALALVDAGFETADQLRTFLADHSLDELRKRVSGIGPKRAASLAEWLKGTEE